MGLKLERTLWALTERVTARYLSHPKGMSEYCGRLERRGLRERYIIEVRRTLISVQGALGPLAMVNRAELEAWWDALSVSAGTRHAYHAHIAGYFQYLQERGWRDDDPSRYLVKPKVVQRLPRPIPDERLAKALAGADYPMNAFLALAAYAGLRAHEIASLRGEHIGPDRLFVHDGKGGRQRFVPIHPTVMALLQNAPRTGPVFFNLRGGTLTANTLSHRANRYLREMGIPDTFHSLRHAFGTHVYRDSQDIRLTQELLGHASIATTALYTQVDNVKARDVVRGLRT